MIYRYPTNVTRKDNICHYVYMDHLKDATFCKLEGSKKESILWYANNVMFIYILSSI